MRTAGLLILAIFFPVLAHAATLVNINTANATLLDTLPGIGPSKATAIIDYRTQHGPFARIEDIQNVSGIGPSTYAEMKSLITVGDTSTSDTTTDSATASSTSTTATSTTVTSTTETNTSTSLGGGTPEYVPIPTLRIITDGDRTVSSNADVAFTAVVYDGKGNKRTDATVTWSFGDGMRRTGASVFHAYVEPGEYVTIVHATSSDGGDAVEEIITTVKDAGIKISSLSSRGIALVNTDSRTLDLSFWKLLMGGQEFKIPEDTYILAGHTTLFPSRIIELPIADSASLLYPSGEVAFSYPMQPSINATSYKTTQEVEPFISTSINVQAHEEAVGAPAAATEFAGAGAALSPQQETAPEATAPTSSPASALLKSPWTLGFLGLIALAGGAFIFI